VYLLQHTVLDHAHPRLARSHVDQDFFTHRILPELTIFITAAGATCR
jgi:hypothetical protein